VVGEIAADSSKKTELRRQIIAARDALPPTARETYSAAITAQLLALDAYRSATRVVSYMSFGSEFDTAAFNADALSNGKQLCLPRVDRTARRLDLHIVENLASDLQSGVWGIREPRADRPAADMAGIDFVLLPGVAFTSRCERLGYGGGFYDRLIPRFTHPPPLVAAAFSVQVCETIPLDVNDQRIDVVVTESAFYCNCD
jgi:5-formyltetrahydrofolate cyclo-ligase